MKGFVAIPLPTEAQVHQATLHNCLLTILSSLSPHGVWAAPNPAPLTANEVEEVFKTVKKSHRYKKQTLMTLTSDSFVVSMKDGLLHREKAEHV